MLQKIPNKRRFIAKAYIANIKDIKDVYKGNIVIRHDPLATYIAN